MKKRVTLLLNISLGLWIAYYALFFIGYFAQKPLFWRIFGGDYYMSDDFKPVYSPTFLGMFLVIAAVGVILNLLLRKNATPGLCIGAEVFAAAAFEADILVKSLVPMVKTIIMGQFTGSDGVSVGGLHSQSIGILSMALTIFFAASLTLMVCACCITQFERRAVTQ